MSGNFIEKRPRILHIDDDPEMLELFQLTYSAFLDSVYISNPDEALALLNKEQFDAVITDFEMPDKNGLEVLSEIKALHPELPVIFYTGQGNEEVAREAFILGASDYFVKELDGFFHREKLVNSIKKAIEINREKNERILAEEALRLYAEVYNSIPSGVMVYQYQEPDKLFLISANPAALRISNMKINDILGRDMGDIWPKAKELGFYDAYINVMQTTLPHYSTPVYYRNNELYAAYRAVAFKIHKDKLCVVFEDIREQIKIEKALKESQAELDISREKFSQAFMKTSYAMTIRDIPEGRIEEFNESFCTLTGYSPEEIKGKTTLELGLWVNEDLRESLLKDLLEHDTIKDREIEIITKTGERKIILISGSVFNLGEKKYMLSSAQDITDKRKAELLLQRESQKLQNILDSIPWGVYITNNNYDIEYLNPITEKQFGKPNGKKCYEYFNNYSKPCDYCKNQQVFRGETVQWTWFSEKDQKIFDLFDMPFVNTDGSISKIEFFNDITERVSTEKALQKSEAMYRSFIDNTQEAIYVVQDGLLKFVNHNCTKLTRIPEERLLGMSIFDFMPPETTETQKKYHQNLIKGVIENIVREIKYKIRGGKEGWLLVNTTCIEWDSKPATLNFATEITAKKAAEEELLLKNRQLEKANEQLRAILETIPDLLFELDADGRFLSFSSLRKEMLYAPPEIFLGKTIQEILPPDVSSRLMTALKEVNNNEYLNGFNYSLEIDGKQMWYSLSMAKKQNRLNEKPTFIAYVRDITERKAAEEALKQAETSYRNLFESSMDAIIIQFPPDWRFVSGNPAAIKLFGFESLEELTKFNPEKVSPDEQPDGQDSAELALDYIEDVITDGFTRFEWICKRKDGSLFPASIQLVKMEIEGQTAISATVRDITEMKNAENKLILTNKELKEFAYRVTHELKNPVKIMKGYINLLNEEIGEGNFYVGKIDENASRLMSFIDAELQLARTGQSLSVFKNINLNEMLFLISATYTSERKPRLTVKPNLPAIEGDPDKIRQVFTNLYSNSIRYSNPEAEYLTITVTGECNDGRVIVRFTDNGMGIPAESLEKIFQPGYTKGSNKGTGFGLTIANKIIEAHGGRIWAESPGRKMGTTFCIELPERRK